MSQEKDLQPITRKEKILDGQDLTPVTRLEYFLKKAATGGGGAGLYIGTPITIADAPPLPEGYQTDDYYAGLTDNDLCPIYVATGGSRPDTIQCVYPYMDKLMPVYMQQVGAPGIFYNPQYVAFKVGNLPHVDDDPNGTVAILTVKSSTKIYSEVMVQNQEFYPIDKTDLEWVRIGETQ